MPHWEKLDVDQDGGVIFFDYDESTDTVATKRVVDVEPILERVKQIVTEAVDRKSEMRCIMAIPIGVAYEFAQMKKLGPDWYRQIFGKGGEALLSELVHDRDLSGFRTIRGDFRGSFKRR